MTVLRKRVHGVKCKGMNIIDKIKRIWMKLRLQPIRVFCFHQVSEWLDESEYAEPDWMALSDFKQKISDLRKAGYVFISLQDAHRHLKEDWKQREEQKTV